MLHQNYFCDFLSLSWIRQFHSPKTMVSMQPSPIKRLQDNLAWAADGLGEITPLSVVKSESCSAAATAKSLQLCLTLCDPIDGSPLGSSVPGILQTRTLEWAAISFSNAWKWKLLNCVQLFATPWTIQSMEFSRPRSYMFESNIPGTGPGICTQFLNFLLSFLLFSH